MPSEDETPVVVIVFNRPEETARLIEALKLLKPLRLFVIGDGPRTHREGEEEQVHRTRELFSHLPWRCDVSTNWSEQNMGCHRRVASGLTWVFSQIESAIILEDDCIPDATFFPFCAELLGRYRDDSRILSICGTNSLPQACPETGASYYFSNYAGLWGWATWKRAWDRYADSLEFIHEPLFLPRLRQVAGSWRAALYWSYIFRQLEAGRRSSWGYRWLLSGWRNNGLCIIPRHSLVKNVGFTSQATHTSRAVYHLQPVQRMPFPLIHPIEVFPHPIFDRRLEDTFYSRNAWERLKWLYRKTKKLVF